MKRTFLYFFFLLTLCSAAAANQVYHPFVEAGKRWCVHGFNVGSAHCVIDYYFANDEETIDGKTYLPMYEKEGEQTTLVGLFREENQRVYLYKKDVGKEFLTYDFSLQEGDEFTPEYGDFSHGRVTKVTYKDVNGERLKVISFEANDGHYLGRNDRVEMEWIEGIGYPSTPLAGLFSKNMDPAWYYYTAYILYDTTQNPYNYYLPFSFHLPYDGWWGQQLLQINTEYERNFKLDCEFLPDPENDCYKLHVYGYKMLDVSPNKYVYCIRESDNKLRIQFEELDPVTNYTTPLRIDLYFPFFSPGQYTYVDELGEHPVPIREALVDNYRPFVEDGKVWKVGLLGDAPGWFDKAGRLDFYYFDGDTIIDGRDCKKMMRKTQYSHEDRTATYVGALYEENRCVYCALPNRTDFVLLYDFVATPGTELTYYSTDANEITKGFIKERSRTENEKYHGVTTIVFPSFRNIYVDYDTINLIWREGVGYNGFNNGHNFEVVGGFTALMSCTIGDEVLYFDPEIIDCVTPDDGGEVKKNTIDFTHIVKTQPKAPGLTPSPSHVGEGSEGSELTGEYSLKKLFVNFKPLAGPYVITICDDSGTEVYRKEVQTSNVIGLNTDISDYPNGEYTITIENNDEAYTANFSIDDAVGINRPTPDPSLYGGEKAGANKSPFGGLRGAFDLSGRKVGLTPNPSPVGEGRKLPRGVYIKDGRKIVVR